MKFILWLMTLLSIPLMLLNAFGGIISGIWLAILGEWGTIGYGFVFMIGGILLLGIPLLLAMIFMPPAIYFTNKGYNFIAHIFTYLGALYTAAVITAWSMFILIFFVDGTGYKDFIPTLIWTYSVATAPLAYMASKEQDNEYTTFTTFFSQLAYLCVVLLVALVSEVTTIDAIIVFGFIMFIGSIVQMVLVTANTKERQLY